MELKKFFSHRKKVSKILGYSLVVFVFAIVAIGMFYKFAKKTFYFFNTRADVVLTDSMSVKNEKYEDFLKGTKQIQAFDFVISKRITDKTKLKVYDVVIFDNPDIGIDMHRIVEINQVGDNFIFDNISEETINDIKTFKYAAPSSSIVLEDTFSFTDLEIVTYTQNAYDEDEYYFNIGNYPITPIVVSNLDTNGYYKNTISYHRDSAAPTSFSITKKNYECNSYFESIKLSGGKKSITINSETIKQAVDGKYAFNISEKYRIRGDKANTDDGWYEKKQLKAKVVNVIPKVGFVFRFLSTPFGAIMLIGLMFIPISYWTFFKKKLEQGKEGDDDNEE